MLPTSKRCWNICLATIIIPLFKGPELLDKRNLFGPLLFAGTGSNTLCTTLSQDST